MKAVKLKDDVYWVGAKDFNLRDFHGYKTPQGSTYNAYLIIDEKITLVDTVKEHCFDEMMERISSIIDPKKIDVVVSNHVEPDHSGALPQLMEVCKNAVIYTSPKGVEGLGLHYDTTNWEMIPAKTGDEISLGKRKISFVNIPMLHWPDSMMTYMPDDKILFPNDGFGQHIAPYSMFDDENPIDIIIEEAKDYFANILLPYAPKMNKLLDGMDQFEVDLIAPSHGVIWRSHIDRILMEYKKWCDQDGEEKAVIIYDTMWGSTEKMARDAAFAFEENNIPVVIKSLKVCDKSEIIREILTAKYVAIGSSSLNGLILPPVSAILNYIEGLRPKNKIGFAFGSYGWKKNITKETIETMERLKWSCPIDSVEVNYKPTIETKKQIQKAIHDLIKS